MMKKSLVDFSVFSCQYKVKIKRNPAKEAKKKIFPLTLEVREEKKYIQEDNRWRKIEET